MEPEPVEHGDDTGRYWEEKDGKHELRNESDEGLDIGLTTLKQPTC